jgi:hypothetical protein
MTECAWAHERDAVAPPLPGHGFTAHHVPLT